jgi:PleD family two-component response regulator
LQSMKNKNYAITFSVGITSNIDADESIASLLKKADVKMYESKRMKK